MVRLSEFWEAGITAASVSRMKAKGLNFNSAGDCSSFQMPGTLLIALSGAPAIAKQIGYGCGIVDACPHAFDHLLCNVGG
jgi:hypothetical protein